MHCSGSVNAFLCTHCYARIAFLDAVTSSCVLHSYGEAIISHKTIIQKSHKYPLFVLS